jgi:hypothetical protein
MESPTEYPIPSRKVIKRDLLNSVLPTSMETGPRDFHLKTCKGYGAVLVL